MIEVFANGRKFAYWTAASVARSIDHIAATFSLTLVARSENSDNVHLFPGDSVEIAVDGEKVLSGFVDKFSTSFSQGSHQVNVSGNEKTIDLSDCCIESPFEWENKKMDEIIRSICARFGIRFDNRYGVDVGKPFARFAVEPGSKAIDTLSKLCKERGVMPCSDGRGTVFLFTPEKAPRGPMLRQGENLVSASVDLSLSDRFSKYTVYGTGKAKSKAVGVANDQDVQRSRPFVLVDSNSIDKDKVQARADWECRVRKAKSMSINASVVGWTHSGGLWEPGTICSFIAPELFVRFPLDLLVSGVEYSWGSEGQVTNLTLVQPDSFLPQPETSKVKKSAKADPWASIKKAVQG